jgi:hypothetical protein
LGYINGKCGQKFGCPKNPKFSETPEKKFSEMISKRIRGCGSALLQKYFETQEGLGSDT